MAVEIRLRAKYTQVAGGSHKSTNSNSGVNKRRGETDKTRLATAQDQTRQHQKVLVLVGGRKRAWRRM
jgi:hypothetical protein